MRVEYPKRAKDKSPYKPKMKQMKTITIKPGMKFEYNTIKYPWLKGCFVRVIKKHGSMFKCTTFDGVFYGEDLFYKWELETMIRVN